MIEYEEDWLVKLLFKREGSVAVRASWYGLFSAGLAVLLLVAMESDTSQSFARFVKEISKSQLWNASTVVIALLLGFRTKNAYSRFWEGTSLLHQMRGEWFDTASNLITFTAAAKSTKPSEVTRFRQTLVRLMSLCHATALEEIAGSSVKLDAIDTFGLDTKTLKHLTKCAHTYRFNQVEIMLHIIQTLITTAHEDGVIKIPPPILSRVYQTLSRGFVNVLNAKKICDTRFPFPYAQMIAILLLLSAILMPLQIVALVEVKFLAAVFTFVPVWGFVALNIVAHQLEDPFGTDSNDLPLQRFQEEMNGSLLMLLHPDSDHIPTVKDSCNTDFKDMLTAVYASEGIAAAPSEASFVSQLSRRLSSFDATRASTCSEKINSETSNALDDLSVNIVSVHTSEANSHPQPDVDVVTLSPETIVHEALEAQSVYERYTDARSPLAQETSPSVPSSRVGLFAQGNLVSSSPGAAGTADALAWTPESQGSTVWAPKPSFTAAPLLWTSPITATTTSSTDASHRGASQDWALKDGDDEDTARFDLNL